MPLFNRLARIATSPLPRMISPRGHAIFDYVTAGAFFAIAGLFWPRNKRAAIASLLCGSAEMAVNLITDYDGDRKKVISLRARRQIDLGLAAMTATMPDFLAF